MRPEGLKRFQLKGLSYSAYGFSVRASQTSQMKRSGRARERPCDHSEMEGLQSVGTQLSRQGHIFAWGNTAHNESTVFITFTEVYCQRYELPPVPYYAGLAFPVILNRSLGLEATLPPFRHAPALGLTFPIRETENLCVS